MARYGKNVDKAAFYGGSLVKKVRNSNLVMNASEL